MLVDNQRRILGTLVRCSADAPGRLPLSETLAEVQRALEHLNYELEWSGAHCMQQGLGHVCI